MGTTKLTKALAAMMMTLSAVVVLSPNIFELCESPMHCHYSYLAELGMAAVVFTAGMAVIFSRGYEPPRMLGVVAAVAGLFMILYPSWLIGVCASTKMACNFGLKPTWNLLGGGVIILSLILIFTSKEVEV